MIFTLNLFLLVLECRENVNNLLDLHCNTLHILYASQIILHRMNNSAIGGKEVESFVEEKFEKYLFVEILKINIASFG